MYTVVYGRTAFWSGPYTPTHRRNLALQGCVIKVAVTSTNKMNFWPQPANLTHGPRLMFCASGYVPGHLPAQSPAMWRAHLTTISGVPDADHARVDDYDWVRRKVTLAWAVPKAFPHFPLDVLGRILQNNFHLAPVENLSLVSPQDMQTIIPAFRAKYDKLSGRSVGLTHFRLGSLHLVLFT